MKPPYSSMSLAFAFALTLLTQKTSAHYYFPRLIHNNTWTAPFEYVRRVSVLPMPGGSSVSSLSDSTSSLSTSESPESPESTLSSPQTQVYPQTNVSSADMRCGRNATTAWAGTKTRRVESGDWVGFGVGLGGNGGGGGDGNGNGNENGGQIGIVGAGRMYHPGIASAWLSKSLGEDLSEYRGDGPWIKILQTKGREAQSVDFSKQEYKHLYDELGAVWGTYQSDSWNFTIPATTPPGKYLLRFEHIFPNKIDAQFYVNCAHIEVVGAVDAVGAASSPTARNGEVAVRRKRRGRMGSWGRGSRSADGSELSAKSKLPAGVEIPGVYTSGQEDVYFEAEEWAEKGLVGYETPEPRVWMG